MRIYVAGPYTAESEEQIAANVQAADDAAREIARRGQVPFCPHKMTWHWEKDPTLPYESFLRIDMVWLGLCDAILLLPGWERSEGTKCEERRARELGLMVFTDVVQVPVLGGDVRRQCPT